MVPHPVTSSAFGVLRRSRVGLLGTTSRIPLFPVGHRIVVAEMSVRCLGYRSPSSDVRRTSSMSTVGYIDVKDKVECITRQRRGSYRTTIGYATSCLGGPTVSFTPCPTVGISKRDFSSNEKDGKDQLGDGQDHHAFFQEQLRELEQERTSLLGRDDDKNLGTHGATTTTTKTVNTRPNETSTTTTSAAASTTTTTTTTANSSSTLFFSSQLEDWREEQITVFGQQLQDTDMTASSPSHPPQMSSESETSNRQTHQHQDDLAVLEDMKEERELLFQFTTEERTAWGQPLDSESMQQVLAEVAKARSMAASSSDALMGHSETTISPIPDGDGEHNDTLNNINNSSSSPSLSSSWGSSNLTQQPTSSPSDGTDTITTHHQSFSHVSADGGSIHMVDVGNKAITARMAHAQSKVIVPSSVLAAFDLATGPPSREEMVGPKGPIFATAKLAGIMAAKRTSDLIPLCHPMALDQVHIDIRLDRHSSPDGGDAFRSVHGVITIDCTCRVTHKTGVEMEALTGATIAALTIYDMTKAVSHEIVITDTKLLAKTGGKRNVIPRGEEKGVS